MSYSKLYNISAFFVPVQWINSINASVLPIAFA